MFSSGRTDARNQRDLTLDKRIQFVQQHLLAKIRRVNTAIAWFVWQGDILRAPLSTLQREKIKVTGTCTTQRSNASTFHIQTTEAKPARRDNHSGLAIILELEHKTWKTTISCGNNGEDGISSNICDRCSIHPGTTEN